MNPDPVQIGPDLQHWSVGDAGLREQWAKKANEGHERAKGDHQDQVHSVKMVLVVVRRGGWTA